MSTWLFEMEPPATLSKDILGAGTAVLAGFALNAGVAFFTQRCHRTIAVPQYGDTGLIPYVGCHVELWFAWGGIRVKQVWGPIIASTDIKVQSGRVTSCVAMLIV